MIKKPLSLVLAVFIMLILCGSALAAPLKPVADPWDDPNNLVNDGETYYTSNEVGYVIVWETPACSNDGKYLILNNGMKLKVEHRLTYMDNTPWGHVTVPNGTAKDGTQKYFSGWILMTDLVDINGDPVVKLTPVIPEHPMIQNPESTAAPIPTPEATEAIPQTPTQAITIVTTYNNAIVYTSVAIAVIAVVLVVIVLVKHKAVNKKGE